MPSVSEIYRINPDTGERDQLHRYSDGLFRLVDGRIPLKGPDADNWRNLWVASLRTPSIEQAAYLIENLDYSARMDSGVSPSLVTSDKITVVRKSL
jgi:hypothetical protein